MSDHKMKWEVLQQILISILALAQSRVSSECSGLSRKVLDITQPIKAAMAGTISEEYFISSLNLKSVGEISPNTRITEVIGMYETGCSVADFCEDQIHQVIQFAENVVIKGVHLSLMISLKLDINKENRFESLLTGTQLVSSRKTMFLVRLTDNITCSDVEIFVESNGRDALFQRSSEIQINGTLDFGFGYSQNLISCIPLKEVLYGTSFTVLFMKYGNSMWIPESFGIFKNSMDIIHERNLQLVGKISTPLNRSTAKRSTFYLPIIEGVQAKRYHMLLEQFGNKWMTHQSCDSRIILQANLPGNEPKASDNFSLSTYIRERNIWFTAMALHTLATHFKSIFLLYDDWIFFHSKEEFTKAIYKQTNIVFDRQIDVILDFPYSSRKPLPNGTDLETHFRNSILTNPLEHINVRALLITLIYSNGSYSANIDENIVLAVSKDYTVGCKIAIESLEYDQNSYISLANLLVKSCKRSNGSMYVLYLKIKLNENEKNTNKYYTYVRKRLETLNTLRNHILNGHKEGSAYVNIDLTASDSFLSNNTLFCNTYTVTINEYYEAILNWGKLNDLPIVLKTAFDPVAFPDTTSWFSYLRPTLGSRQIVAVLPFFVLRNYPNQINNWTTDPCIQWTTSRPTIRPDYFHTPHVGATYHTSIQKFNQTLHEAYYKIMLQLVFNRFQVVELVVENNLANVFKAISELVTVKTFDNKHIYLNYDFKHLDNNRNELFISFHQFLMELKSRKLPHLLGVHLNLSEIVLKFLENDEVSLPETNALWENVASTSRELNISLGILVSSESCILLYHKFALGFLSVHFKLMDVANYIVCNDKLELITDDTMERLGGRLDTYLYIKNGFKECWPRLTTIFRTEVNLSLDKNAVIMDDYVTVLSHFQKFAKVYDTTHFLVEAFDTDPDTSNGWWALKNDEDLNNPVKFLEREAEISQYKMWYPVSTRSVVEESFHVDFVTYEIIAIATAVVSIVIVVSGIIVGYVFMRYRSLKKYLSEEEVKEFLNGRQKLVNGNAVEEYGDVVDLDGLKFSSDCQLSRTDFIIDDSRTKLGAGSFGTVYKGLVNGRPAALKTPNQHCSKCTFKNILSEVKVLCHIRDHPNVVRFLGAYVKEIQKGILYIATELCSEGSLEIFLRKQENVLINNDNIEYQNIQIETTLYLRDLIRFSLEIARAMEYIHERCVLHGDLAARNVLLSANLTCKVGDFGLSRKVYEYQKYVKKSQDPLPWKWMAFESLTKMEFTRKSDVWGYGVTLWEIFSLGAIPYGGLNWTIGFAEELSNGRRLNCPKFAPETIYLKMLDCWHIDINQRPTFGDIVNYFQSVTNNENSVLGDYTNLASSNL